MVRLAVPAAAIASTCSCLPCAAQPLPTMPRGALPPSTVAMAHLPDTSAGYVSGQNFFIYKFDRQQVGSCVSIVVDWLYPSAIASSTSLTGSRWADVGVERALRAACGRNCEQAHLTARTGRRAAARLCITVACGCRISLCRRAWRGSALMRESLVCAATLCRWVTLEWLLLVGPRSTSCRAVYSWRG